MNCQKVNTMGIDVCKSTRSREAEGDGRLPVVNTVVKEWVQRARNGLGLKEVCRQVQSIRMQSTLSCRAMVTSPEAEAGSLAKGSSTPEDTDKKGQVCIWCERFLLAVV